MRILLTLAVLPAPAFAHVGHLGEAAGHDHWVAGAAVGIAIGIGLWQAAKDRKARKDGARATADEPDGAEEETPA